MKKKIKKRKKKGKKKHTTGGKFPVERALNLNISFVFKYLHDLGLRLQTI